MDTIVRQIAELGVELERGRITVAQLTTECERLRRDVEVGDRDSELAAAMRGTVDKLRAEVTKLGEERYEIHAIAMASILGVEPETLVGVVRMLAEQHDSHRSARECFSADLDEARQVLSDVRSWGHSHPEAPCMQPDLREAIEHHEAHGLGAMIRRLGRILEARTSRVLDLEREVIKLADARAAEIAIREMSQQRAQELVQETDGICHDLHHAEGDTARAKVGWLIEQRQRERLAHDRERVELRDTTKALEQTACDLSEVKRQLDHEKAAHENTARVARQLIDDAHAAAAQAGQFRDEAIAKLRKADADNESRREKLDAVVACLDQRIDELSDDRRRSFSKFGEGVEAKRQYDAERGLRRDETQAMLRAIRALLDPPAPDA